MYKTFVTFDKKSGIFTKHIWQPYAYRVDVLHLMMNFAKQEDFLEVIFL